MIAYKLADDRLLVPIRAESDEGIIGDAMVEIGEDDPTYEAWLPFAVSDDTKAYDPLQPRWPKGTPLAGRWRPRGGGMGPIDTDGFPVRLQAAGGGQSGGGPMTQEEYKRRQGIISRHEQRVEQIVDQAFFGGQDLADAFKTNLGAANGTNIGPETEKAIAAFEEFNHYTDMWNFIPEPLYDKVSATFNKVEKQINNLEADIEDWEGKLVVADEEAERHYHVVKKLKDIDNTTPEYFAARQTYMEASGKQREIADKLYDARKARDKYLEEDLWVGIRDIFIQPKGAKASFAPTWEANGPKPLKKGELKKYLAENGIDNAADGLAKYINSRTINRKVDQNVPLQYTVRVEREQPKDQRAYASFPNIQLYANTSKNRTFKHELGHIVENSVQDNVEFANAFHRYRTAGEPATKLADHFPHHNYDQDEFTRLDRWDHAYTGKTYTYRPSSVPSTHDHLYTSSTEITSMGFDQFFVNPYKFWKSDPEHFMFTVTVLSGAHRTNVSMGKDQGSTIITPAILAKHAYVTIPRGKIQKSHDLSLTEF